MAFIRAILSSWSLWRCLFYWLLLPLFIVFTLFNIALNSRYTKGQIEGLLFLRTGEQWELNTLTWSLDGKLHIYDLSCQLGDGVFEVEHVQVTPKLPLLLKRKIRLSEVVMTKPSLELSDHWILSKLAERAKAKEVFEPEMPLIAVEKEVVPEEKLPVSGDQADEAATAANPIAPTSKKISVKTNGGVVAAKNYQLGDEFEAWFRVNDASIKVNGQHGGLFELLDLDLEIPMGGKDLVGKVAWSGMKMIERQVLGKGEFNLEKHGSILSVKETELNFFGINLQPDAYLGRSLAGMSFYIDLKIPEQSVEEVFTHLNLTMDFSAEQLAGRMQLAGELTSPLSWQAIADVRALGVKFREGHRGTTAQFDSFVLGAALRRGVLQLPQLQLRGDEVSVLSNGVMSMNGSGFGIVRLVTSPEKRDWVNKLVQGSHFFEGAKSSVMQPLETNDLYLMDVNLDGSLLNPMMQVEGKTAWQPLWPAIGRMRKFVKEERLEERASVNLN